MRGTFSHIYSLFTWDLLGYLRQYCCWCCFLERGKRDHRIMERFWRNLKNHLVPIPLPWKRTTSTRLGCSEPYSAWDWPTASVGNTFECLTILTEYSTLLQLKAIPPLSCHYTPVKKNPSPALLHAPLGTGRILQALPETSSFQGWTTTLCQPVFMDEVLYPSDHPSGPPWTCSSRSMFFFLLLGTPVLCAVLQVKFQDVEELFTEMVVKSLLSWGQPPLQCNKMQSCSWMLRHSEPVVLLLCSAAGIAQATWQSLVTCWCCMSRVIWSILRLDFLL